jgi:tripartite-type tricarboxylate transporter receptor subunit TctC
MGAVRTYSINQFLYTKLPYDPVKDFAPVTVVASVPNVLVVNAAFADKNKLTDIDIVKKLQQQIAKSLAAPAVKERLISQGADPVGNTLGQFAAFIQSETQKWAKVVKASGAKVT